MNVKTFCIFVIKSLVNLFIASSTVQDNNMVVTRQLASYELITVQFWQLLVLLLKSQKYFSKFEHFKKDFFFFVCIGQYLKG